MVHGESIGRSGAAGAGSAGAAGETRGTGSAGELGETTGAGHAGGLGGTAGPGYADSTGTTGLGAGYALPGETVEVDVQVADDFAWRRASRFIGEHGRLARTADAIHQRASRLDLAEKALREERGGLDDFAREHPFTVIGLGVAAGLMLGLGGDERVWTRLRRRLRRGTAIAATAGAALVLERLLARPRAHPPTEADLELDYPRRAGWDLEPSYDPGYEAEAGREPEPDYVLGYEPEPAPVSEAEMEVAEEIGWLIPAEEARAFADLPATVAGERVAALWEQLAMESLPPRVLCLAGDLVVRLTDSHPQTLAPDMLRLFGVWPELANTDATLGAQVAWTAGRAGPQRVVSALDFALQEAGVARTVAEAFVEAALGFAGGSNPPLSHGVHRPPSTVYPYWPRDGRRGGGPPPPPDGPAPERRDIPGPVHLGVAAPHAVRPRNTFLAYFAAYTDEFANWVREKLMQELPPEELRLDKKAASWKDGTEIVVVPVSEALDFDPPQAEFTWNGQFEILDFACTVREQAPLGTTVLEFQVGARVPDGKLVQFEKVRVSLGILEDAPVSTPRLVARPMATSAFISYATPDQELVSYKLSPLRPLGIKVYDWRVEAIEGEVITDTIARAIRDHDLFFLFWSRNAQASGWVEWEIERALEAEQSGRPRIIPQLLENLDEQKDLPPALHGRQFFSAHFFLDRPERIRALVEGIGQPALAPAGTQPGRSDADGGPGVPAESAGND